MPEILPRLLYAEMTWMWVPLQPIKYQHRVLSRIKSVVWAGTPEQSEMYEKSPMRKPRLIKGSPVLKKRPCSTGSGVIWTPSHASTAKALSFSNVCQWNSPPPVASALLTSCGKVFAIFCMVDIEQYTSIHGCSKPPTVHLRKLSTPKKASA